MKISVQFGCSSGGALNFDAVALYSISNSVQFGCLVIVHVIFSSALNTCLVFLKMSI